MGRSSFSTDVAVSPATVRRSIEIASDHPFVNLVVEHAVKSTGMAPPIKSETYWTEAQR
jgi:hypothetical protein